MTRTVAGATVLITGAGAGMGFLYARRAVDERARNVILWDRDAGSLAAAAAELTRASAPGTRIHATVVELTDGAEIAAAAKAVRATVGDLDVLINNAGIVVGKLFWEHHPERDIERTIAVNTLAPMLVTRAFLPGMIARRGRPARIVTIASAAGLLSNPKMSVYSSSKWAAVGWSDSLRLELERTGNGRIAVTTVCPSYISTGMFEGVRGPFLAAIMTPEYVVDRVWRAMLAGRPRLLLPRSVYLSSFLRGALPVRAFDSFASAAGIYRSMDEFVGHDGRAT